MDKYKNSSIIISGPSGSGKTQFIEYVEQNNSNYVEAFGCTTRSRRENEVTAMYFINRQEFETMIKSNEFIEYCEYKNNYYGVPKSEMEKLNEINLMFNVGYSSARVIKELDEKAKMIYLLPPTRYDLLNRLEVRGKESDERYLLGIEETINYALKYEYLLISYHNNMQNIYDDFMDITTQNSASLEKRLVLAKNRDFINNYYKLESNYDKKN